MTFTPPTGMQKILSVDDQPDNLFLLESILDDDGYDLISAASGQAALEAIDTCAPDLVLLDVMMPDMDGYEVTRRIRNRDHLPYIPILLITAHNQSSVVEGLDAGADDFIRKPFDMDELRARVRSLLRLKASIDAQAHVMKQRDDFVARMTHDLRTPMVAANRMLQFCLDGAFGQVATEAKEAIANTLKNNQNLLSMINTLLEVYRHEAGQRTLTFSSFNFCDLVGAVVDELEALALEKQLSCAFYPTVGANGDRTAFNIYADRLELRRVVTNLIGNAIKFTDEGHIHIYLDMHTRIPPDVQAAIAQRKNLPPMAQHARAAALRPFVETQSHPDIRPTWLRLQVKDTGVGIALEHQAEMFEWFRQGKHNRSGNGLGLHLAQRIATLHGGIITVESALGKGSCFSLYLPSTPSSTT